MNENKVLRTFNCMNSNYKQYEQRKINVKKKLFQSHHIYTLCLV